MLADPAFAALLPSSVSQALDADESIAIGVWKDLSTAYFNEAYVASAKDHGGKAFLERWGLGRSILDPVPANLHDALRGLYASTLTGALNRSATTIDNGTLALTTHDPSPVLTALAERDALQGLQVTSATLEDVFLTLTGREYRA